jgi:chromosome segregation ATPase
MLNEEHIATYRQAKADIDSLNGRLIDKRQAVAGAQRQITEHWQRIGEIGELLKKEDLALENPSRLRQPTLTEEQYEAQRQTVAELEATFPDLQGQIEKTNREIARLESELSSLHGSMNYAFKQISAGIVEQSAAKLIELAGEPFRDLVTAIIADKGIENAEKVSIMVCERLFQLVFSGEGGYVIPDTRYAYRQIADLIETAA